MLDKQFLDNLTQRITRLLPRAGELGEDVRQSIKQLLQRSLGELNILTQAEFDDRVRSLERAEQRIRELESQLAGLESRLRELEEQAGQARPGPSESR